MDPFPIMSQVIESQIPGFQNNLIDLQESESTCTFHSFHFPRQAKKK